jgi:hypothetical protein
MSADAAQTLKTVETLGLGRVRYQAHCLHCGHTSGDLSTQSEAAAWAERHRVEPLEPMELVVTAIVTLPSGARGMFFQAV